MKIEYHPKTASDLNDAAKFYNQKVLGLGDEFREEVYRAIRRIQLNPQGYKEVSAEKRRCRVNRFPYSVIFRIIGDEVIRILVIRHHRQRPEFGSGRI